jgi:hypothetical protein
MTLESMMVDSMIASSTMISALRHICLLKVNIHVPDATTHLTCTSLQIYINLLGHPSARNTNTTSTYFYNESIKDIDRGSRNIYVSGASVQAFESHELKEIVSRFGEVVYITYLLMPKHRGAAFVSFQV